MNIFASDPDPAVCAAALDDKRVIKMVLESAQLLSTAINELGGKGPYRSTHRSHPCSIWTKESRANYLWLYDHFLALCEEYTKRYHKIHKCYGLKDDLLAGATLVPDLPQTDFANCTTFKEEKDVHEAYRSYLAFKWQYDIREPKWFGSTRSITVGVD